MAERGRTSSNTFERNITVTSAAAISALVIVIVIVAIAVKHKYFIYYLLPPANVLSTCGFCILGYRATKTFLAAIDRKIITSGPREIRYARKVQKVARPSVYFTFVVSIITVALLLYSFSVFISYEIVVGTILTLLMYGLLLVLWMKTSELHNFLNMAGRDILAKSVRIDKAFTTIFLMFAIGGLFLYLFGVY